MAKLNLYLDRKSDDRPLTVFHYIRYKGKLIKISTTHQIESKHWDSKKQIVKRSRVNYNEYNAIFREQQNAIESIILKLERTSRPITKENIISQLSFVANSIEVKENTPLNTFQTFIQHYGSDKADRTIIGYKTTLLHLSKFSAGLEQPPITFKHFDADFYKLFRASLNLHDNAFGFHIKNLKTYMRWAYEKGFHDTEFYKKWKVTSEEKDVFFLKFDEIKIISKLELEPKLDRVRDLFLVGCYTGFAFSDIQELKPAHVQDGLIIKTRVKTKSNLTVPVIPDLQIILDKYWKNNVTLPKISNQKGNAYLKEIGKKALLNRHFNYTQQQGRKTNEEIFEAWEMLTFHTARHSFITNCIQLGILPEAVRQIVGHKSFKMLSKYIQNDPEFLKKEMKKLTNIN